jgi:lysozyme
MRGMGAQVPSHFHQNASIGSKGLSYTANFWSEQRMNMSSAANPPYDRSCVIDISHHNGKSLDFALARQDGIRGVIHKASQGAGMRDPMYLANQEKARDAGLLWGAYHFGTGSDSFLQAQNFVEAIGDPSGVLMALDLEPNPAGPSMTLAQARTFVMQVYELTGRWPGLYSGHAIKRMLGHRKDPVLANCWLWLAQYGPKAVVPPNWPTWTLWQYTDGTIGGEPKTVRGIGLCDRNRFNGSEANLRKLWHGR